MANDFSIISYSFRNSFETGRMDLHGYMQFCADNGFTRLDPWMLHLEPGLEDERWLARVKESAGDLGLPFGCIAVDGGHIYEKEPEEREKTRRVRERWLDVAEYLGADTIRIDAGGPEDMPNEVFEDIVAGYAELIPRARERGLGVVVENHWGPTKHPANVVRLLKSVDGLGLLFDTGNWADGEAERGWELCAKYATMTHIKTRSFDSAGNETSANLSRAIELLRAASYRGPWGIESTPEDEDERRSAISSIAFVKREIAKPLQKPDKGE